MLTPAVQSQHDLQTPRQPAGRQWGLNPSDPLEIDPDNNPNTPNAATLNHDAKGNLTLDNTGLSHTYDFDNQLEQVVVSGSASRGDEGTHTYEYDALGRRIAKSADTDADGTPDETTVFVYSGQQCLIEYTDDAADTSPTRSYIYCQTCYIDEPITLILHSGTNSGTYYYHRNRSYNVIGLTDDTGAIVELYAYTLYGERTIMNASWAVLTASAYGNQRGFQGLRHDAETSLIENRARVLDPLTGRFLQRDPLGYPDGMNAYAAYHVMWGGEDAKGLSASISPTVGARYITEPNYDEACECSIRMDRTMPMSLYLHITLTVCVDDDCFEVDGMGTTQVGITMAEVGSKPSEMIEQDMSVCQCLLSNANQKAFNEATKEMEYRLFSRNSSWAMKCYLENCGFSQVKRNKLLEDSGVGTSRLPGFNYDQKCPTFCGGIHPRPLPNWDNLEESSPISTEAWESAEEVEPGSQ